MDSGKVKCNNKSRKHYTPSLEKTDLNKVMNLLYYELKPTSSKAQYYGHKDRKEHAQRLYETAGCRCIIDDSIVSLMTHEL